MTVVSMFTIVGASVKNTVTIDTHRHGQRPSPEGRIPPIAGEMSRSDKGGAGPAGPHDIFAAEVLKVS